MKEEKMSSTLYSLFEFELHKFALLQQKKKPMVHEWCGIVFECEYSRIEWFDAENKSKHINTHTHLQQRAPQNDAIYVDTQFCLTKMSISIIYHHILGEHE